MSVLYFIVQQTMYFAIPLLVVALGALYSERSGIVNIALEGIMILGAFVGVLLISSLGESAPAQLVFMLALLAAAAAGALYSLLLAWASIRLCADQIIGGTALNMFAPAFCIFAARGLFGAKQVNFAAPFFIAKVPLLSEIPVLGPCLFTNCYLSTYVGFVLLLLLGFVLKKTRFGLRLCACGENPEAAASAGIDVSRMRYAGVLLSGLLGGAGGAIFVVTTSTCFSSTVVGYGFLALAVLIMGRWKPAGILLASFFFGALKAVSSAYSGIPVLAGLGLPSEIYKLLPYVLTLLVLAFSAKSSLAPKAEGKPYDDGRGFMGSGSWKRRSLLACGMVILLVCGIGLARVAALQKQADRSVSGGYGADIALLIRSGGSIDDKGYMQGAWDGVLSFSERTGQTRKYYETKDSSSKGISDAIRLSVLGGAKTIIATDDDFNHALYEAQDTYPDVHFISLTGVPTDPLTGEQRMSENFVGLDFAEGQAGFLAGYAAVSEGYRSLGFMGGMAVPAVISFGYGYLAGADYAAQELGLEPGSVQVRYCYTGTFNPSPEVLSMASSWYSDGVEVIFACGGLIGSSIMKAAENNGGKVIGVDTDQSGDSPTVITSAMKYVDTGMLAALEAFEDDSFQGGCQIALDAKTNAVGLPLETSQFDNFTEEQYQAIYAKLAAGEIDIPDDTRADSVDELPLACLTVKVS